MTITKDDFEWCIHGSVLVIEKSKLEDMAKEYLRSLRVHMFDKEQMDAEPSTKKRDMEFMNQSAHTIINFSDTKIIWTD